MNGARHRVASLVGGSIAGVLALGLLGTGLWALTTDRLGRDSQGYLSIASTQQLQTGTYALVAELRGDGPGWLYGSTVMGDARVRATSQTGRPLFVGIARSGDISRYLAGTGYATIEHLASGAVTTHAGGAPPGPPAQASIWAASTTGAGEQALQWTQRDGDWSILLANADGSGGVAVRGDVSAKVPILLWLALGLLLAAAGLGAVGGWLLLRSIRGGRRPTSVAGDRPQGSTPTRIPTGVGS